MENSRIHGEHFFTSSDNTALFYRHWPALQPGAKKVIVLFHRGHEHSGRLQHLVDELAMPDTVFYAWDARGHGQTVIAHLLRVQCRMSMNLFVLLPAIARSDWMRW
ncbi:esterase [Escherichia coli]|nr:esterase [Escherichia coli]